jgi:homocysteine S-methyltransferase
MTNPAVREIFDSGKTLVMDGALGTMIEVKGGRIGTDNPLWASKYLLEDPEMIYEIHREYYEAGADIGITATYSSCLPGYLKYGCTE